MKKCGVFVAFTLALCFLLFPTKIKGKRLMWLDCILAALGFTVGMYTFFVTERFQSTILQMTTLDYIFGIIAIILVIWATKKAIGNTLAILAIVFVMYCLFGDLVPGIFGHSGFTFKRFILRMYMVSEGIYGITTQTASSYIFLFILFGALLVESGVGEFFTDSARRLTGASPGGPAKVAVVSSGLMGMISGSAAANVATTGAFTIPMMKKEGFSKNFAGAVEATASTGGLIMPPIMGSAAFLMVEYLGVTYNRIMLAAIIPAGLYYLSCYCWVHFEALHIGHHGCDRSLIGKIEDFKRRIWLILPVIVVIIAMIKGYTPIFAAVMGMGVTALCGLIQHKERRLTFKGILNGFVNGSKGALTASIACIAAGIVVGISSMTGIGQVLTYNIVNLSGNNLLIALLLTVVATILLSMGLPGSACYILVATVVAPALVRMGVVPIAAHMFVFYFSSLSNITPPVAIATYTAAGISGGTPFGVAKTAIQIALPGFIIPFLFVYNPMLLFEDPNAIQLIIAIITAMFGVIFMAIGGVGFMFGRMSKKYVRGGYVCGALLLIITGPITDMIGVTVLAISLTIDKITSRSEGGAKAV